jgi:hypothetical protein
MGLPTLESTGRPTTFLSTAADATHNLGTNDLQRIQLMEI